MQDELGRLLKTSLTGKDNVTYEIANLLAAIGTVVFLVLACVNYAKFDPQGFGAGFGLMLGGLGVAMGLRKDSSISIKTTTDDSTTILKEKN